MTQRTLLVGQSGGATAVTNATLAGVVRQAQLSGFHRILGLRHGVRGLLRGEYFDMSAMSVQKLDQLARTPSAALGTARMKMNDADLERASVLLSELDCEDMVLIGGNDSADTALRLHAIDAGVRVVLAPKTVDNDLPETDHCPGYPSAATYFATLVRNATYDSLSAPDLYPVKVIDAMGRDAGWLTAAATLAFSDEEEDLWPLLMLPERPPQDAEEVLALIEAALDERGWVVCIMPETMRDAHGRHLSGDAPAYVDPFGHAYRMPPAVTLAASLQSRLGIQARFERPGSAVRMWQSSFDREEARAIGEAAVLRLQEGQSGVMVTIERNEQFSFGTCPLESVANLLRPLDDHFIAPGGHAVTAAFRDYARPLLGEDAFPAYLRLTRDG
ncbi:MAG: diphosphate--fructose-6-phosphate 1-phosphotransferase [Thermomicrobiales bacterium]